MGGVPGPRGFQRLAMGEEGWNQSVLFLPFLWLCPASGSGCGLVGSGLAGFRKSGERQSQGSEVEE